MSVSPLRSERRHFGELRPVEALAGRLVLVALLDARLAQRILSQAEILIVGRDAGVSDAHISKYIIHTLFAL